MVTSGVAVLTVGEEDAARVRGTASQQVGASSTCLMSSSPLPWTNSSQNGSGSRSIPRVSSLVWRSAAAASRRLVQVVAASSAASPAALLVVAAPIRHRLDAASFSLPSGRSSGREDPRRKRPVFCVVLASQARKRNRERETCKWAMAVRETGE
ncbi:hypothetical protein U9M48_005053, partial [Paspalum notatum var. saurae]